MHSSLVALLKTVLVSSAYLGLMNSAMHPWLYFKTTEYSGRENTKELMLPGKTEKPLISVASFPTVALRRGPN